MFSSLDFLSRRLFGTELVGALRLSFLALACWLCFVRGIDKSLWERWMRYSLVSDTCMGTWRLGIGDDCGMRLFICMIGGKHS